MQLSSCKYFWDSHVCLLINKWATCDIYFFHSSLCFLSHPYWVVLTHPGEAATQWMSEFLRIHSAPMVMAYDAWSLWDTKVMLHLALLCLSGLRSMRSLSVVLAFTLISKRIWGKTAFTSFFVHSSIFPWERYESIGSWAGDKAKWLTLHLAQK